MKSAIIHCFPCFTRPSAHPPGLQWIVRRFQVFGWSLWANEKVAAGSHFLLPPTRWCILTRTPSTSFVLHRHILILQTNSTPFSLLLLPASKTREITILFSFGDNRQSPEHHGGTCCTGRQLKQHDYGRWATRLVLYDWSFDTMCKCQSMEQLMSHFADLQWMSHLLILRQNLTTLGSQTHHHPDEVLPGGAAAVFPDGRLREWIRHLCR